MTSWLIHSPYPFLFWSINSYPFSAVKSGMDRPKQKRVWIDQGVIDSPHCIFMSLHFHFMNGQCQTPASGKTI